MLHDVAVGRDEVELALGAPQSDPPRTGPRDPLSSLSAYVDEGLQGQDGAARADRLLCSLHGIVQAQLGPRPGDWADPGDLVSLAVAAARG